MTGKKKIILIVVAGAVVLGTSWFLYKTYSAPSQDKPVISSHYVVPKSFGDYPWQTGVSYEYSVSFAEEGTFQFNLLAKENQKETELPYSAKLGPSGLEFTLLEKDEAGYLAIFQLKPQAFQFNLGQDTDTLVLSTRQDLEKPVLLKIKVNGVIEWLQFAEGVDVIARNSLRQLISDTIPVLAEGHVQIPSLHGDRTYRQALDRSGVNIHMERNLLSIKASHGQKLQAESRLLHVLDSDYSLLHSEWDSTYTAFGSSDKSVLSKTVSSGKVDFVKKSTLTATIDWRSMKWQGRTGLDGTQEFEQALHNSYAKLIKDTTLDQQIEALRALGANKGIYDSPELFNMLFAFMKVDPESIPKIAALLNEFEARDHRFDMIGVLLAQEASATSQKLLIEYADKSWDDPEKVNQLLFNAALMEKPSAETVASIQRMVDDTAPSDPNFKNVLFNSAGVAFHSQDENFKKSISEHIQRQMATKTIAEDSGVLAMSNLGSNHTYAFAQPYVNDPNAAKRKLGATAMRRVQGDHAADATQALVQLATNDSSEGVRREASQQMISRSMGPEQLIAIEQRLYQETDETVLIQLIEAIHAYPERGTSRAVLAKYNRSCGIPKVCNKVESLLIN